MAYGTRTVPRVDKIVGPAISTWRPPRRSSPRLRHRLLRRPTEIVIVVRHGNPEWIAADLIAQAEHDPQARRF
jgi:histidinol dehydrogenase